MGTKTDEKTSPFSCTIYFSEGLVFSSVFVPHPHFLENNILNNKHYIKNKYNLKK